MSPPVYPPIGIPISYIYHDILPKIKVESPAFQPILEISARQEFVQHLCHCAVCNKKDAGTLHPNTPAANRLPRSSSPCQSCSLGCWVPASTSTAPSAPMRAQSTLDTSVCANTTGECVEIHTWLSYNEVNACKIASMARGCTPFSGSSVTSTIGDLARYGKIVKARMRSVPSDSPDDVTS